MKDLTPNTLNALADHLEQQSFEMLKLERFRRFDGVADSFQEFKYNIEERFDDKNEAKISREEFNILNGWYKTRRKLTKEFAKTNPIPFDHEELVRHASFLRQYALFLDATQESE